ncbi:relaxase domain-containing protein [Acidimicrobiaceae bacterium USS-CC1]|uniref:Relaxase domain-containing protein n=1 Tax=Acidiferrimicrobium australe TaxID=2664430 RepID=A0ABW9QU31_9ACTN|nr:relaxase domain-containing protein [Acidiferrimicrobium australe]
MISIRRISLGGGFRYLMESVAAGDGAAERSGGLARYYASSGTPPGVWVGSGLADLGDGVGIPEGEVVAEEQLRAMLGELADPVSGVSRAGARSVPGSRLPVAGFDLTFSPPKSVSVAWALADEGTKAVIHACHREAVETVVAWAEAEVFHSRSGAGGIVEEDVGGVVAASFTHWASRADDPQLHDHLVIWNRARSTSDGRWRTLDSRAVFKATTTLSELHQGVLSDLLTDALGVGWEGRGRRHSTRPRYEIAGVGEALMTEFSQRAEAIDAHQRSTTSAFVAAHGRVPSAVEQMRIRQASTLATRPDKSHHSLAELTAWWRQRADRYVPTDSQVAFVASLSGRNDLPCLRADDLDDAILADAARAAIDAVADRHATYSRMNVLAEAHRLLHGVRFATPADRIAVAERISVHALEASTLLTPPAARHVPDALRRLDGSSRLAPRSRMLYTTEGLLGAEARLLAAGRDRSGPVVDFEVVLAVTGADLPGRQVRLSVDQAVAVAAVATSGRRLDVLVGPAGTGKSTAMAGLRAAWERAHGAGSVTGLAPSAVAAEVLGSELGIPADNTAKWLTEWRRLPELVAERDRLAARLTDRVHPRSAAAGRLARQVAALDEQITDRRLRAGQLVIVDEASLAGTFALDELVAAAGEADAKVLLVGDPAQLSSVSAGGALGMLVAERTDDTAAQLSDVRRFHHAWEKAATLSLRSGDAGAIDSYDSHGRIAAGDRDQLLQAMFAAWKHDRSQGQVSLMIAADAATVTVLNALARADRIDAGAVTDSGLRLAGGQAVGVGDEVVTRRNCRQLTAGANWVKNGDRWTVTTVGDDGSVAVRRLRGAGEVILPATYVAEHLDLGYATTAHRAQGLTVDTAHALVSPTTTREALYVAATRGRDANHLYVDVAYDPDPATGHDQAAEAPTAREVLERVLANPGADVSAHQVRQLHAERNDSLATLLAEYQAIAQLATEERYAHVLARCGLTAEQIEAVRVSPACGALHTTMRRAEELGLNLLPLLAAAAASATLDDAEDIAAVLHHRVERRLAATTGDAAGSLAGVVPRAIGVSDADVQRALRERERAIDRLAGTGPEPYPSAGPTPEPADDGPVL